MGCDCQDCQFPHKLKDKPEDCTPEQVRECHGQEAAEKSAREEQEKGK